MSILWNCTGDAKDPRQAVEKWTELHCPLSHSHYYYLPSEPELFSLERPVASYQATTLLIPDWDTW